jgi:ABC exporter DevB family membrane fusion protein
MTNMLRGFIVLLVGATLGGAGVLLFGSLWADPSQDNLVHPFGNTTDTSHQALASDRPQGRHSIMALGTIEARDGIILISSPLLGYPIKQVHVVEGQSVQPGQLLIELDASTTEAELQLAKTRQSEAVERQASEVAIARERVAGAELAVRQATEGMALEIEAQQSRIAVADLKMRQTQQDLKALEELRALKEPLASQQQVEHQQIALEASRAEFEAAKAALTRLEQSLKFQKESAASELRLAQQALEFAERGTGIESLRQAVALAELKLAQTRISAASAGMVLNILAHTGEVVAQQPLLQLADVNALVCVAEIEASDVPFLQSNHQARISSRAFRNATLEGKLIRIGNRVSQATLRSIDPRQTVDRSVVKGVIQLDSQQAAQRISAGEGDRRSALIGLQVEVEFSLVAPTDPS